MVTVTKWNVLKFSLRNYVIKNTISYEGPLSKDTKHYDNTVDQL